MKAILKIILPIIIACISSLLIIDYKYERHKNEHSENIEETIEYINVWTTTNVDIKSEPDTDSEIIGNYSWNAKLIVTYIDDNWAKVKDIEHYIDRSFLCESPVSYIDYDVPNNDGIKSYMDYRTITYTPSNQYKLQKVAYTKDGLRMVNDRYCIALGSYYTTKIGQYVDIELENGNVIHGILADCKADKDTDSTNRIHATDGSVVEFVVDIESLNYIAKRMGDISYINGWNSKVINIRVYDKIEEY